METDFVSKFGFFPFTIVLTFWKIGGGGQPKACDSYFKHQVAPETMWFMVCPHINQAE